MAALFLLSFIVVSVIRLAFSEIRFRGVFYAKYTHRCWWLSLIKSYVMPEKGTPTPL